MSAISIPLTTPRSFDIVMEPKDRGRLEQSREEGRLTELQLRILRLVSARWDIAKLSKEAGAPAATIGMEIAKLQMRGYIKDDGDLTAKGREAIRPPE